jgi:molecular chaperone DnaK
MIERNTTIPTKKTQVFSTYADNQTAVDVKILQGERPMARDNKMLGIFRLDGIPIAPRGLPQIEVTFDIDASGILNVSAKDLGSNKNQHITISGASGLSEEEVEKLRKEAEKFAEVDKKEKEKVEIRNHLDSFIYQTEKQIKDTADKLSEGDRKKLEDAVSEAKKVFENKDASVDELKDAQEALTKVFQEMAQELYKNVQPQESSNGATQSATDSGKKSKHGDGDGVVDADFEVIDEKKS